MLHAFCEYTQVRIAVSVSRHCTNQMPLQSLIYDCLAKSIVFPFSWCTDKVFEGFAVLPFGQILAKICFFLVSLPAVSPWLRKKWLRAERHSAHPVQSSQYAPCKNCDIWERILESISAECRHLLVTVFLKNCSGFLYYNVGIKILANCVKTMGKT